MIAPGRGAGAFVTHVIITDGGAVGRRRPPGHGQVGVAHADRRLGRGGRRRARRAPGGGAERGFTRRILSPYLQLVGGAVHQAGQRGAGAGAAQRVVGPGGGADRTVMHVVIRDCRPVVSRCGPRHRQPAVARRHRRFRRRVRGTRPGRRRGRRDRHAHRTAQHPRAYQQAVIVRPRGLARERLARGRRAYAGDRRPTAGTAHPLLQHPAHLRPEHPVTAGRAPTHRVGPVRAGGRGHRQGRGLRPGRDGQAGQQAQEQQ